MKQNEFNKRRRLLMQHVGTGNIAIIPSATAQVRNRDVNFPFRQDSDFYYLTGFNEANALAVFIPGREQGEYILFCEEYDEKKALWEGAHAGLEGATRHYEADDSFPIDDLDDILPGMLENRSKVFYPMGRDNELDHNLLEWVNDLRKQSRSGISAPLEFISLEHIIHEMRLLKDQAEVSLMRKAAEISARAHIRAMRSCRPGLFEYQIEAEIIHEMMANGLRAVAYPSIVAGGDNACVLHYTDNSKRLKQDDLLLIDAGAECDHYAADITRTFPVSGKFSKTQRQLYQLVLDAQLAAIEQVGPGLPWNRAHDAAVEVLTRGMLELGILQGDMAEILEKEAYMRFYPHRIGHWLGMDVHDVGDYKVDGEWRLLEPGMVLTIEPGLYIPSGSQAVDAQWWGIGIRIEDDVLVTETGYEILTNTVPKTIAEIESLMQAA